MKKTLEIPEKGVKVYSPDDGWTDSPIDQSETDQSLVGKSKAKDINNEMSLTEESDNEAKPDTELNENLISSNQTNMVAVGDALEQLFETLNNSSAVNSSEENPTWRDVAELSRVLEEKLDARKDILEKLAQIDEELHSTRKDLLITLKKLGKFENEQLSAATIRASVSAMAIEVMAKKLT